MKRDVGPLPPPSRPRYAGRRHRLAAFFKARFSSPFSFHYEGIRVAHSLLSFASAYAHREPLCALSAYMPAIYAPAWAARAVD